MKKTLAMTFIAALGYASLAVAGAKFSVEETTIGEILESEQAKSAMIEVFPEFSNTAQLQMAAGMTLKQIQAYSSDVITDEKLAKLDKALKAIN
jgi:hypothetical protein